MNYQSPILVNIGGESKITTISARQSVTKGLGRKTDNTEEFEDLMEQQLQGNTLDGVIWNLATPLAIEHQEVCGNSQEGQVVEAGMVQDVLQSMWDKQQEQAVTEQVIPEQELPEQAASKQAVPQQKIANPLLNVMAHNQQVQRPSEQLSIRDKVTQERLQGTLIPTVQEGMKADYTHVEVEEHRTIKEPADAMAPTTQINGIEGLELLQPIEGKSPPTVNGSRFDIQPDKPPIDATSSVWKECTIEEIPKEMISAVEKQENQLCIRLSPKELGNIEISMEHLDGETRIVIQCEQESTKELLGKGVDDLVRVIENATKAETVVVMGQESKETFQYQSQEGQSHGRQQEKYQEVSVEDTEELVEEQQFIGFIEQLRLGLL